MNEFPNVPLSAYYLDAIHGRKQFSKDLKTWLKNNNLDLEFISRNMGKSLGTIRNWMTGGIFVNASKFEQILELCQAHASGGRGVIYGEKSDMEMIGYIWMRPYKHVDSTNIAEGGAATADTRQRIKPDRLLYDKWCVAAGVPEDTLFSQKTLHYPLLAKWITKTIMEETARVLKDRDDLKQLDSSPDADLSLVLQGAPCECSFFSGARINGGGVCVGEGFSAVQRLSFFLPVIRQEWRGDFARMAARRSDLANPELWVVECLNRGAEQKIDADLESFLLNMREQEGVRLEREEKKQRREAKKKCKSSQ